MTSRTLSTTSYAVLGLIAIKDWSTYELSQQAQRSLRHFWPRADSNLYEAAKSLVDHGLAETRVEHVGRRARTVYSITAAGREALAEWISEPGRPPLITFETLVKVFFAEHGSRRDLLDHLERTRADAQSVLDELEEFAGTYADGINPFSDRLPQNTLIFRFMWEHAEMVRRWAEAAETEVSTWPEHPADWPADHQACLRFAGRALPTSDNGRP